MSVFAGDLDLEVIDAARTRALELIRAHFPGRKIMVQQQYQRSELLGPDRHTKGVWRSHTKIGVGLDQYEDVERFRHELEDRIYAEFFQELETPHRYALTIWCTPFNVEG